MVLSRRETRAYPSAYAPIHPPPPTPRPSVCPGGYNYNIIADDVRLTGTCRRCEMGLGLDLGAGACMGVCLCLLARRHGNPLRARANA